MDEIIEEISNMIKTNIKVYMSDCNKFRMVKQYYIDNDYSKSKVIEHIKLAELTKSILFELLMVNHLYDIRELDDSLFLFFSIKNFTSVKNNSTINTRVEIILELKHV